MALNRWRWQHVLLCCPELRSMQQMSLQLATHLFDYYTPCAAVRHVEVFLSSSTRPPTPLQYSIGEDTVPVVLDKDLCLRKGPERVDIKQLICEN